MTNKNDSSSTYPYEIALQCDYLAKHFGNTIAVNDLSFSLKIGRFMALLGPSGCGKTTSLRMIAGLEHPTSGRIQVSQQIVVDNHVWVPPHQRKIGLVFQDYALFPHMTVSKNVAYGLNAARETKQRRVMEVLELVGLYGLGERMPHELSGGQQQRVALARALAPSPQIMLLDEPFSNLDASLRLQVREDVRRILNEAGVTTVLVTHDQEEAFSLAGEVGVMLEGELQQIAPPREVYQFPATRQVAQFVGDANFVVGEASGETAVCVLGQIPLQNPFSGLVEILVRPENLALSLTDTPQDGNATVEQIVYLGYDQLLHLRIKDHDKLLVARIRSVERYTIGQSVHVHVVEPTIAFPQDAD
jgi:iron(III) transport system ATP-binding protein